MRVRVLSSLFAALLLATSAFAQTRATTADLVGSVQDQLQGALPGAIVSATNLETKLVRTGTAAEAGRFAIPALPPGTYRVRAERQGFAAQTVEGVVLTLGSTLELVLILEIGGLAETVVVHEQSAQLSAQGIEISSTLDRQQIETLPTNLRNFIAFSLIAPGVTTDRTPQQGAAQTSGLSFGGQRGRSNNVMVDGLHNNDEVAGGVRATFSQEAVREFQVLVNSYSAEFGRATGGVVNIITKSGSNQFQGNAFAYLRDESLNAKEHFEKFSPASDSIDRDKAPYGQLQFGGTLGGPIRKDRTFFFGSFERLGVDAHNFVTISERDQVLHPFLGTPMGTPADILRRAGFLLQTGNVPYAVRTNTFLLRADHQFAAANSLALRFNTATLLNENAEPFGGLVARSRAAALDATDYVVAGAHTIVVRRMVNEVRFQIASRDQLVRALDPTCSGPCDSEDEGGPTVEVIGVASVGRHRFTPQPRRSLHYQVVETIANQIGSHEMKAGIDFNYIDPRTPGRLPLHFGGRYLFAELPAIPDLLPAPVSAIQAFALGLPAAYVQGYGNSGTTLPYSDLALFVQDSWRPSAALTLKAGLRYEHQFWPAVEYRVAGYPGRYEFPRDNLNLAPRVGVAWDMSGRRTTTLHGAYGVFYGNHITAVAGITDIVDGEEGVRTLALRFPASLAPWRTPDRRLPEPAVPFPSLEISIDPALRTPSAHQLAAGIDREVMPGLRISASFLRVRGFNQIGTIDYNPLVPALGPGRRPADVNGTPGSSASVLQYTSFGETWYRGVTVALASRAGRHHVLASYTLSKAEDNSTDFQTVFLPQSNGAGRNASDPDGLPVGFDPETEKGPSLQDQRHRFVVSALAHLPAAFTVSSIVTVGSGRPYTILAGVDLNQDGDGGAFPPDRARRIPSDEATSVPRNSGTMPYQATVDVRLSRRFAIRGGASVDAIVEAFNLFNRTNFTEINNIFGTGRYPDEPLPTFGLFEQAGPPRQVQLAARLNF